jgi:hypothetical protein
MISKIISGSYGQVICSDSYAQEWVKIPSEVPEDFKIGSLSFRLIKVKKTNRRKHGK